MEEKILVPMTDSEYQEWKARKASMTEEELIDLIIKAFPYEVNRAPGDNTPELYIKRKLVRKDNEVDVRIVIRPTKQFNY